MVGGRRSGHGCLRGFSANNPARSFRSERLTAFQPGTGATGEAFRSAQPVLTTDRLYGVPPALQDVYNRLIASDLTGVISLPILDGEYAGVIAVLNVDVCGHDVDYRDLSTAYDIIKSSARFGNLKRLLNELDKAWLTIGLRSG